LEGAHRYQSEAGDFDSWVRGIARNLWRTHLRRRKPTTTLEATAEATVAALWDERSPHEQLEQDERLGRLRGCLERLAPAARQLVRDRYEAALSSATIATQSGRTPAAIDTALCRIRAALLDCLGSRA